MNLSIIALVVVLMSGYFLYRFWYFYNRVTQSYKEVLRENILLKKYIGKIRKGDDVEELVDELYDKLDNADYPFEIEIRRR